MRYKTFLNRLLGAVGFVLVIVSESHAVEDPAESAGDGKSVSGRVFEAVTTCLPLVAKVQPNLGPPSTLFHGSCSCSKVGSPDICPTWTYYAGSGAEVQFERNFTVTGNSCMSSVYLRVNLTNSYSENITLKCKLPGFRSESQTISVKKMGNFRDCLRDDDCKYQQQQCLKFYEYPESKVCRCPHVTDLFDEHNSQVCVHFVDLEQGSDQQFLVSILMIVIITVLATAILLLGFRMFPLARFCPGYVRARNESRMVGNTVPIRHTSSPTRTERGNQDLLNNDHDSPPPPYSTVVLANPPDYNESQKDAGLQNPR